MQIEGDEYGFIASPKKIMRAAGASETALVELIEAGFVHRFDSGVLVMMHWDMANTRKNDRKYPICFPEEFAMLGKTESGKYFVLESNGIQRNPLDSQQSLA